METVISILNKFDKELILLTSKYMNSVQDWITSVIAIAFLLYIIFSVALPLLNGKEFDIPKLATMLILYGMFKIYPTLINSIDLFFQIPAQSVTADILSDQAELKSAASNLFKSMGSAKPPDTYNPAKLVEYQMINVVNSIRAIPLILYSLVMILGIYILFAVFALIKLSSMIAASIIMILGTIPFALSFLPGFSGGVPSLLKNLLAVRLWPFVAGLIMKICLAAGLMRELLNQLSIYNSMLINPDKIASWDVDLSPIVLIFIALYLLSMTPKFVDMALNVSVSGGAGNMMGAASVIGGITSLLSGGAMTAAQSALGIGDGSQQSQQNQLLTSINSGIGDLTKALLNNGAGGINGGGDSSGSPVDKSTSE